MGPDVDRMHPNRSEQHMIQPFTFATTGSLRFGAGRAVSELAEVVKSLGPRMLLITDAGLRKLGLTAECEAELTRQTELTVFDTVEADPSVATLEAAVALGRDARVTGVIGLGGGSPMDVAKVAALLLGSAEPLAEAWGVNQARGPRLPLCLVPTTAGTGSEVTPVAILTIGGEEKRGVVSPLILPDIAILDPDLTLGLPPATTGATGLDAMVHAIEAYTSRAANQNPISMALAVTALTRLGANIEGAVADGQNRTARAEMLLGSMLAGQAFANAPVAAVHALAYPIGGIFHIPHGLSNALVLAHVMRFNTPECAAEYAALAPAVFPGMDAGSPRATAEAFIDGLTDLAARIGLPPRLRDVGIPSDALPRMAAAAMLQTRLLVNNPRTLGEADALAIYQAAW